jgi:hypothetical protein
VGWNTLDGYACDIMDIWKIQHMLGRYPCIFQSPTRPPGEKALLLNAKKEVVDKEIQHLGYRGLDTMAHEVSVVDLDNVSLHFWIHGNEEGIKHRANSVCLSSFKLKFRKFRKFQFQNCFSKKSQCYTFLHSPWKSLTVFSSVTFALLFVSLDLLHVKI